jgi:hypothetical protein
LNNEVVYLSAEEIYEIAELETIDDVIEYMKGMTAKKKQVVMTLFNKEMVIKQWKTIAMERY